MRDGERPSDDSRGLYAPVLKPAPLPVMEPIAGFTGNTEGRKRVAEARKILESQTERRAS